VDTIRAYGHAKEVLAAKVPVGFFLVALCQFNGFGTPKSADNAAETLSEHVKELIFAAGQGDKYAEYGAGYCYLYGIAIDKNVQNALDCFKRSAEKGFAPAMVCLGKIYADKGDKDLARSWYKKAADLFDAEGQFLLSQIEIDTEYCEYLRKSCADQGYAPGISAIAKDYWDGKGMERNRKKAIELWGLAADKGDTDAIFSYCDALIKAIDIVTDVDYLKLIMPHIDKLEARHGNLFQIGMDIMIYRYHRKGIGGNEFPITKGMEFIEKSVSDPLSGQDNENNYNLIWEYFTNNLYHKKDKKIALTFIKKHAEAGSEAAKRELKLI
jgi:TPR repeat protein